MTNKEINEALSRAYQALTEIGRLPHWRSDAQDAKAALGLVMMRRRLCHEDEENEPEE